ncbi:hypothetical protein F5B17DRAFT_430155 [Nemania serpens]|nr:hypothetical protein F5B17DRAFT_430155 [Nemania serpens]
MPQVTELIWVPLKSNEHRDAAKKHLASVRDEHLNQPSPVAAFKVWKSEEAYNASHGSRSGKGFKSIADASAHEPKHHALVLDGAVQTLSTARVVQVTTVTPDQAVSKAGFAS